MRQLDQHAREIFEAALKLPPKGRAAYLDQACGGEAQLRQRIVEALFKAQEDAVATAQASLSPSAQETIVVSFPTEAPGEKPGDWIGHYKLLEQRGEGGMGTVWVAEQCEPVRRKVALKIIKLGMDTRQVIARFEAERQALALMDHPNIAKVLDAGATDKGRPYFVMELVLGEPITTYCDRQNLPTRERLDLFVQVCRAIQHAHQKGIIHRDIKPSNILVALQDGVPVPKVIDFGIAKATAGQQLTDKTLYTALEQFIGTPAYMSPEQAEMAGVDIDTRSDIYSLGVTLYELLTSKVPFDPKRLLQAGLDEIRRIIREEEPARPSTRISTLDAVEQITVAKRRQSEPPKLIHQVRWDLDWIVMKCLEKDRTRRYETANGLAVDIQRHLNDEPVIARPPSNVYRFRKLVLRNKLAFAAVGAIAGALVFGLAISTVAWVKEQRAQRLANQQRKHAESEARRADLSAYAERIQREKAEQAVRRANEALSTSLVVEGERLAREDAAGKALAYFARAVRLNPSNHVAATRIVSLLSQHDFPLPLFQRPGDLDAKQRASTQLEELALSGRSVIEKRSGRELSRLAFEGDLESDPSFSADGEKVAFMTSSNKIEVFFTHTGDRVMPPIRDPRSLYTGLIFTPDNRELVIGHSPVELWDLITGKQSFQRPAGRTTVLAMGISRDGRLLATGLRSGEARLWNLLTAAPAREPCPGPTITPGVKWSPYAEFLATTRLAERAEPNEWRTNFWDIRPGRATPITLWNSAAVQYAGYDSGGSSVATVCRDGTARIWNSEDGLLRLQPVLPGGGIETLAFSPNSALIAAGGTNGDVGIWDLDHKRMLWSQRVHSGKVSALSFSPDSKYLFSGAGDKSTWTRDKDSTVNIVEATSGTLLGRITNTPLGAVESLAVSPDGHRLAIAYQLYRAEIWDWVKPQRLGEPLSLSQAVLRRTDPHSRTTLGQPLVGDDLSAGPGTAFLRQGWVFHAQFSHDGNWLVTSAGGDAAELWDARVPVNRRLQVFPHGYSVVSSFFSADDKLLLTCSGDGTARIWDRASGKEVAEPLIHVAGVAMGCFSRDGREVLTASRDGTAMVWDTQTGCSLSASFRNSPGPLWASFSPDGSHILVAGADGAARIYSWLAVWDPPPGSLADIAEAAGGYRLNDGAVSECVDDAAQKVERLRDALAAVRTSSPLVEWARWYFADRGNRPINFRSKISVHDYANQLAKENRLLALEEAVDLDPHNALAYAKLAAFTEPTRPETAALYRQIARDLGRTEVDVAPSLTPPLSTGPKASSANGDFLDPGDSASLLKQVGKSATVKGQLVRFGTSRSGTFHYLDFTANYRVSLNLAFRISDNPLEFRPELLRSFVGKTVIVEGTIGEHLGQPQILMKSLSQIKVVDDAANPAAKK
jgi:serine/threonine protein kinase/WD40 repeat protein